MLRRVRRALISVSDKSGLIELAKALVNQGVELISTGGTFRSLQEAGLAVREVSEVTGFGEMPVAPARDWTFQHNLPTANQICGLLAKIQFDAIRRPGFLRERDRRGTE